MVKNIFLEIEYLGTDYFGFQIQSKKGSPEITIQGVLEKALNKLFRQKIRVAYAGRTDRGVHARAQAVNFKVNTEIPLKNIKQALNSFLPQDIRIKKVKYVSLDFHARFWAKSKLYRYVILHKSEPSVFWRGLAWHINEPLDLQNMRRACRNLRGKKDFSLFAKDAEKYESGTRSMKDISIKKKGSLIHIDIEADGFLRHMARNIVSFLVKIGSGKINSKDIPAILKQKAPYFNKPAPAQGLYLCKVKYE